MSVGCVQLREGVVWNADDCRAAEARVAALERVVRRARFKIEHTCEPEETEDPYCVACCVNAAADGRALDAAKKVE